MAPPGDRLGPMIARITGGWLPLSEAQLEALGWPEGQALEVELVGNTLIATPAPSPTPLRQAPPKGRKI